MLTVASSMPRWEAPRAGECRRSHNITQDAISRRRSWTRFSEEIAMRKVFAGLMVSLGLFCGVTWAQNVQRDNQAAQPGAVQPRPAVTPGQTLQPGQAGQQGQSSTADQQIAACI